MPLLGSIKKFILVFGMIIMDINLQAADAPKEVFQKTLQAIYNDLEAIKEQYPMLSNLSPKAIGQDKLEYQNGIRTELKTKIGTKHIGYEYSDDFCYISVRIEYPTKFRPILLYEQIKPPDMYGEVQGKPLAVWINIDTGKQKEIHTKFYELIKNQLKNMPKQFRNYKELPTFLSPMER